MKYYAYLKQNGEGCDYTIGCAQTIITIEASSDSDACEKLSEKIEEEYRPGGDSELSKVLLFRDPIQFNLKKVYDEYNNRMSESKSRMQHLKDNEEFERLRKKLNK